jgi:hypothetical protein
MHRHATCSIVIVLCATTCTCLAQTQPRPVGLAVSADGTLAKGGAPFRGVGVNVFDLFNRTLADPGDTSYEQALRTLADLEIPFVRFAACGFWPRNMELYQNDKDAYFDRLDAVVDSARRNGVGLIPSLFWYYATVPDLVGESMDQWGNPKSKTHAFMRTYTREIVTRYRDSAAIWGWEFGNEFNLQADLPNAEKHRPKTIPQLGTPATRSARDEMTHQMFRTAVVAFAEEVRRHDRHRIISAGNATCRPSAWHQLHEKSWKKDTHSQSAAMYRDDNPLPCDVVSVHWYPDHHGLLDLEAALDTATEIRKPLFVGEFGVPESPTEDSRARFTRTLRVIEERVPLAALWVFDFHLPNQEQRRWNVTMDNERAYQLKAIAQVNERLRARSAKTATQPVMPPHHPE